MEGRRLIVDIIMCGRIDKAVCQQSEEIRTRDILCISREQMIIDAPMCRVTLRFVLPRCFRDRDGYTCNGLPFPFCTIDTADVLAKTVGFIDFGRTHLNCCFRCINAAESKVCKMPRYDGNRIACIAGIRRQVKRMYVSSPYSFRVCLIFHNGICGIPTSVLEAANAHCGATKSVPSASAANSFFLFILISPFLLPRHDIRSEYSIHRIN